MEKLELITEFQSLEKYFLKEIIELKASMIDVLETQLEILERLNKVEKKGKELKNG
mgnify:CR=1 FL=1